MARRILVVEDEAPIREMVCFVLEQNGFQPVEAEDYDSAVNQLNEPWPDLILLDWMLPGGSGLQFIKLLKREAMTRDIPVVMLTARGEEEDRVRGLETGADDYITKPFSPKELVARIKFPQGVKKYIKYCQEEDKATQRPYTSRYIGSLVADFHRNLLKGGIYLYPSTASHPEGKLRLLYECNPMAFLAEQAGGKASDGKERILDIIPESLHQRRSFFVGNNHMVEDVENFIKAFPDA